MNITQAVVLGIAQGLCEFLPVSSSGHLVLLQKVFGIGEGALFFDTMLHIGTLAAVFAVYRQRLWGLARRPFQRLTLLLGASTLVTAAAALLFRDFFENAFGGGLLGPGFLATAAVLCVNRYSARGGGGLSRLSVPGAIGIGLMQGAAILPGLSRSGATIAGGGLSGLNREAAADYSFLLSIPAILGSLLLQLPDTLREGVSLPWACIGAGTAAAAASGYFAIRLMLRLIRKKSLMGFAAYTAALGTLVLLDQFVFHRFF